MPFGARPLQVWISENITQATPSQRKHVALFGVIQQIRPRVISGVSPGSVTYSGFARWHRLRTLDQNVIGVDYHPDASPQTGSRIWRQTSSLSPPFTATPSDVEVSESKTSSAPCIGPLLAVSRVVFTAIRDSHRRHNFRTSH